MENLKGFFKKISPILVTGILVSFTFSIVIFLGGNTLDAIILSIQIISLFFLIYMSLAWLSYVNELSINNTVQSLKSEINDLREKTKNEQNEMQDYFLMWVHQIKTPITVSKLIVDTMEIGESKHKLIRELLAIEYYSNMAISYLKISRSNTDMDISEVKLDDIIRPIIKKYSILFIYNHIQLIYETIEDRIITDSRWFGILIEQLISNAVKYTRYGKVGIRFDKSKNILEIYDTGIGIRSEDIPKIFDKGYSGFNGRVNQKSSGLGLFMVKKIADRLNLDISVNSVLNEGSQFFIEFK